MTFRIPNKIPLSTILLGLIVLAAFLIRITNLNYNSPFLDEAIYIQVGLKALSGQVEEAAETASWVGGFPLFYPVISASLYSLGGLTLTRSFNALLGTFLVFLAFYFTKQLMLFREEYLNAISGLIAASFTAFLATPIALSRLANYDALSFTLFLMGIIILHKAIFSGERFLYPASVIFFFSSFLAKYITAIFFPFLFLIPLYLAIRSKNSDIVWGIIQYFCTPFAFLMIIYALYNLSSLQSFFVNQAVLESVNLGEIMRIFFEYTWILYALSIFSLIFFLDKRRPIVWILFTLSLTPLAIHLITRNDASIAQHSFLSLIFIAPLAATVLVTVIKKSKPLGAAFALIIICFIYYFSIPQIKALENFWPNTNEATKILREKVSPSDQILAESDDVVALALKDKVPQDQIAGPFSFSYQGNEGISSYTQAIQERFFNFVELENAYFSDEDIALIEAGLTSGYSKIYDNGRVRVYQRQ